MLTVERLERIENALRDYTLHAGECLIQWIDDDADGQSALIRFNETIHPFERICRLENGKQRTRIVQAIFIEVDDSGSPVNQQRAFQVANAQLRGGKRCRRFHILKGEADFHRFIYDRFRVRRLADLPDQKARADYVEEYLRHHLLGGMSSKMLDHDPDLAKRFDEEIVLPYKRWRREQNFNE